MRRTDRDNLLWFLRFYRRIRGRREHALAAKRLADGVKAGKTRLT